MSLPVVATRTAAERVACAKIRADIIWDEEGVRLVGRRVPAPICVAKGGAP